MKIIGGKKSAELHRGADRTLVIDKPKILKLIEWAAHRMSKCPRTNTAIRDCFRREARALWSRHKQVPTLKSFRHQIGSILKASGESPGNDGIRHGTSINRVDQCLRRWSFWCRPTKPPQAGTGYRPIRGAQTQKFNRDTVLGKLLLGSSFQHPVLAGFQASPLHLTSGVPSLWIGTCPHTPAAKNVDSSTGKDLENS